MYQIDPLFFAFNEVNKGSFNSLIKAVSNVDSKKFDFG